MYPLFPLRYVGLRCEGGMIIPVSFQTETAALSPISFALTPPGSVYSIVSNYTTAPRLAQMSDRGVVPTSILTKYPQRSNIRMSRKTKSEYRFIEFHRRGDTVYIRDSRLNNGQFMPVGVNVGGASKRHTRQLLGDSLLYHVQKKYTDAACQTDALTEIDSHKAEFALPPGVRSIHDTRGFGRASVYGDEQQTLKGVASRYLVLAPRPFWDLQARPDLIEPDWKQKQRRAAFEELTGEAVPEDEDASPAEALAEQRPPSPDDEGKLNPAGKAANEFETFLLSRFGWDAA